jgi:Putative peptidoglycan binding domain
MARTPAEIAEIVRLSIQRGVADATYVNTVNLGDRVTIDFVHYPGATQVSDSWVDPTLPSMAGRPREIRYRWERTGAAPVERVMASGRITIPLPPGQSGTLTVFNTSWRITRAAAGTNMDAANTLRGVQQRLNRLGYHLRGPGAVGAGVDGSLGGRTELAILQFQNDYRRPAPPPVGLGALPVRLQIRGEWTANPGIQGNLNTYDGSPPGPAAANPSAADGASLQTALRAVVGS